MGKIKMSKINKTRRIKVLVGVLASTVLLGCQTTQVENTESAQVVEAEMNKKEVLTSFKWQLSMLNGETAGKGEGGKPVSVNFDSTTNKVSGFSGCNNYFASYSTSDSTMTIGHLAMTRKFCSKSAELESAFAKAMTQVKQFDYSDNKLHLKSSDGKTIAVLTKA